MRGVKSLLVLVVVLAGLGAYIYFVESKKPQGEPADAPARRSSPSRPTRSTRSR